MCQGTCLSPAPTKIVLRVKMLCFCEVWVAWAGLGKSGVFKYQCHWTARLPERRQMNRAKTHAQRRRRGLILRNQAAPDRLRFQSALQLLAAAGARPSPAVA